MPYANSVCRFQSISMRAQLSVDPVWSQLLETALKGYVILARVKTLVTAKFSEIIDQLRGCVRVNGSKSCS